MDPLSITTAVVGLLKAVPAVIITIKTFIEKTQNAPHQAKLILQESTDFESILSQLQSFLLLRIRANAARSGHILVEQVILTLTGSVLTFSELQEVLNGLKSAGDEHTVFDRVKWVMKEGQIEKTKISHCIADKFQDRDNKNRNLISKMIRKSGITRKLVDGENFGLCMVSPLFLNRDEINSKLSRFTFMCSSQSGDKHGQHGELKSTFIVEDHPTICSLASHLGLCDSWWSDLEDLEPLIARTSLNQKRLTVSRFLFSLFWPFGSWVHPTYTRHHSLSLPMRLSRILHYFTYSNIFLLATYATPANNMQVMKPESSIASPAEKNHDGRPILSAHLTCDDSVKSPSSGLSRSSHTKKQRPASLASKASKSSAGTGS